METDTYTKTIIHWFVSIELHNCYYLISQYAATHSDCSTSKADDTEIIHVQLSPVKVKPSRGKQCCSHRGDFDELTSHHEKVLKLVQRLQNLKATEEDILNSNLMTQSDRQTDRF